MTNSMKSIMKKINKQESQKIRQEVLMETLLSAYPDKPIDELKQMVYNPEPNKVVRIIGNQESLNGIFFGFGSGIIYTIFFIALGVYMQSDTFGYLCALGWLLSLICIYPIIYYCQNTYEQWEDKK